MSTLHTQIFQILKNTVSEHSISNGSILVLELHGEQFKQQGWVLLHLAVELLAGQVPCLLPNNLQQHLLKTIIEGFC